MWAVLELCLVAAIVLVFITEFFVPLLFNKPLFGSFRKSKPAAPEPAADSLEDKITKARQKADEVKQQVEDVQQQAYDNYKTAEQLKDDSEKIL